MCDARVLILLIFGAMGVVTVVAALRDGQFRSAFIVIRKKDNPILYWATFVCSSVTTFYILGWAFRCY